MIIVIQLQEEAVDYEWRRRKVSQEQPPADVQVVHPWTVIDP